MFIRIDFLLKFVFCTCNIKMIQNKWFHRIVSFTEKKFDQNKNYTGNCFLWYLQHINNLKINGSTGKFFVIFGPHFSSLNSVQTSVGVQFCYRLCLERIRRLRKFTIYDFRQVHLVSVKNVMSSHDKNFDFS